MENIYSKLTLKDIEEFLIDMPDLAYPKYHGDGLYEISKGCFTGSEGIKMFNEALTNELKNFGIKNMSKELI